MLADRHDCDEGGRRERRDQQSFSFWKPFSVAFTKFDYDTIIELSTAWADALRCVKEFISLALGVTKTDM